MKRYAAGSGYMGYENNNYMLFYGKSEYLEQIREWQVFILKANSHTLISKIATIMVVTVN